MTRPDYRAICAQNRELYHYGVKHRSGRYPWGSGEDPYQSEERKKTKLKKMNVRLQKKFNKVDQKASSKQKTANKYFQKAVKKEGSFFSTEKGVRKAYDKAASAQKEVNRQMYRANRSYQRYLKKVEKMGLNQNPELQKRGQTYYDFVTNSSQSQYQAILAKKIK